MNLWVKRTGQLLSGAVALFFFSCADESSLTGFPNPHDKFDVSYIEIPLESKVYRIDSVLTQNLAGTLRLMAGSHTNNTSFGKITATGVSNIYPLTSALPAFTDGRKYVYDSVFLNLRFDYYCYGSAGKTTQAFAIHELADTLSTKRYYYADTPPPPFVASPLGTAEFDVDAVEFKKQFELANASKDTTVLKAQLENEFGQRLFTLAKTGGDTWNDDSLFSSVIKGIAIVPDAANDKVVGFDHLNSITSSLVASRVIVHYHIENADNTVNTDSLTVNFGLGRVNYTKLDPDFSGSPLSELMQTYQDVDPGALRYTQTGTGVITKVDFSNFFTFVDQFPNMIINSCELTITGFEDADKYPFINSFSLRLLKPDNKFRTLSYEFQSGSAIPSLADREEINYYAGSITDVGSYFSVVGDDGNAAALTLSEGKYSTYISLFAQQLYEKPAERRHQYFGLFPVNPSIGKAIDRTVFNKDNLKLKVYYTLPKAAQ
jgi:hypothetical protein